MLRGQVDVLRRKAKMLRRKVNVLRRKVNVLRRKVNVLRRNQLTRAAARSRKSKNTMKKITRSRRKRGRRPDERWLWANAGRSPTLGPAALPRENLRSL